MAGDGRFRYCYAPKGGAAGLLGAARDSVGERGWVWSRAELLEEGLLGTGATGTIPGRIGDVVIAARDDVAFVDPALPNEVQLRSGHGSLSPDEMLVPLVAARGRGVPDGSRRHAPKSARCSTGFSTGTDAVVVRKVEAMPRRARDPRHDTERRSAHRRRSAHVARGVERGA